MSVLVYTENWEGRFKKLSFELVSYGKAVADMIQAPLVVVSIGEVTQEQLETLGRYGADKIVTVNEVKLKLLENQAYAAVLGQVAEKENASVVVLANNNTGKGIAPRLSVRLKAGLAAGVTKIPASVEPFMVTKKVYSGNAFAHITLQSAIKILTLQQNSYKLVEHGGRATVEPFAVTLPDDMFRLTLQEVQKQTGQVILTDAEIVVSGGRGMKSPDNWGVIEELADVLGAATACSRPVSDEGWRPHSEHTGQTGKILAPNLYIAAGISGATQHLAGISASKCIVAINTDRDAPIFGAANYGIVGDAMQVLPKLTEAIKEVKAS